MRVLAVVQRYGADVAGGAEQLCRWVADGLAARGHHVEVLTSCARSYVTWANELPPGTETDGDVTVHRLPTVAMRNQERFDRLSARLGLRPPRTASVVERSWMIEQGPNIPDLGAWLDGNAARFDVAVLYTYLYATTTLGIQHLAGRLPVVLHATAHDEPPIHLKSVQSAIRQADLALCSTPEEAALLDRITHGTVATAVVGIGVELHGQPATARPVALRRALGDRPYVVVLGRADPAKGTDEVVRFFATFKQRHPGPLAMAVVGERVHHLAAHEDVAHTGFLDEADRDRVVGDAVALIQPSYFESFSLALCEGWLLGVSALVNGACDVLDGQARRSGGAIPYRGYAEFEAALSLLLGDERLRTDLAAAGARYVEAHYGATSVLDAIEREVSDLVQRTGPAGRVVANPSGPPSQETP